MKEYHPPDARTNRAACGSSRTTHRAIPLALQVIAAFALCGVSVATSGAAASAPVPAASASAGAAKSARSPGFAPEAETMFAPIVMLAPPGPDRAGRAITILDHQLAFQRRITFHPVLAPSLQEVVDQLPPRESTLIRAAELYSKTDIPWETLPDGTHQIVVAGHPDGRDYQYSLMKKYQDPEEPAWLSAAFGLKPAAGAPGAGIASVIGNLGGALLIDSYGVGGMVDTAAAALRQVHGDLKAPWDKVPGKFNHHDVSALARLKRDMPSFTAKFEHYFKIDNVVDEFEGGGDPIVLFNFDAEVRKDSLKPFPNLSAFYNKLAASVTGESAIYDTHGNYWMRSGFEHDHFHQIFMVRDGLLVPFDQNFHPAGNGVALDRIDKGVQRSLAGVRVQSLGMSFGLDNLGFTTDYTRDCDSAAFQTRMNAVPNLVAPPVIHGMLKYLAGEFLRVMAEGNGGMKGTLSSRRLSDGNIRFAAEITGEFDYSPTLQFLARVGDEIADAHNDKVRTEERQVGEELFDAFVADYNNAKPKILQLDDAQAGSK
jgi:hypothetical protein